MIEYEGDCYLSKQETAKQLGIALSSLATLVWRSKKKHENPLSSIKIGKWVYYKETDVKQLLETNIRKNDYTYNVHSCCSLPFNLLYKIHDIANNCFGYIVRFKINSQKTMDYLIVQKILEESPALITQFLNHEGVMIHDITQFTHFISKIVPLNIFRLIGKT